MGIPGSSSWMVLFSCIFKGLDATGEDICCGLSWGQLQECQMIVPYKTTIFCQKVSNPAIFLIFTAKDGKSITILHRAYWHLGIYSFISLVRLSAWLNMWFCPPVSQPVCPPSCPSFPDSSNVWKDVGARQHLPTTQIESFFINPLSPGVLYPGNYRGINVDLKIE